MTYLCVFVAGVFGGVVGTIGWALWVEPPGDVASWDRPLTKAEQDIGAPQSD